MAGGTWAAMASTFWARMRCWSGLVLTPPLEEAAGGEVVPPGVLGSGVRTAGGPGRAGGLTGTTKRRMRGCLLVRIEPEDAADEGAGALVLGVVDDLAGRALLDDEALVEEDHGVGGLAGEADLVGDDDHGRAGSRQVAHDVEDLADQFGVESGGRLVEQHDLRVQGQRAGDGDPLALPAGQRARVGVGLVATGPPAAAGGRRSRRPRPLGRRWAETGASATFSRTVSGGGRG